MRPDQDFVEVIEFLNQHWIPNDSALASSRFLGFLPLVSTYSSSYIDAGERFEWVVLHQNELNQVNPQFLANVVKSMIPAFVNSSYVIFCGKPYAVAISTEHPYLKSFLSSYRWLEACQGAAFFTKLPKLIVQSLGEVFEKRKTELEDKLKAYYATTRALIIEIREERLGQIWPVKPTLLNLMVNDVCNSRCQMCLIWKNKKDKEFSPDELTGILSNTLFSELQYVGVSGGEPTLRADLPEIFEAICKKEPKILGTGIITNGIIEEVVKRRVLKSAEVCKSYDVPFNIMISLDGIGEIHDLVRGRENNFKSSLSLIHYFIQETDIPVSFGCTITISNAPYVDEFLDYVKEKGLYGRFRIAEFIDRLYNDPQSEFIRAFDDRVAYHLALFFFRLEHDYEQNPIFQKTYRNIRMMLGEGKPRQIGCQYQTRGAVLTSRGDLLYCSPKSPILGNAIEKSANSIYFSNIAKRVEVIKNHCEDCIHDYHEPITMGEKIASERETRRRKKYDCSSLVEAATKIPKALKPIKDISELRSKSVLIVGWYGTETTGDKAILWSVVERLKSRVQPPDKIYLSSLYPFVSRWTVREMELDGVSIVETYSKEFEAICNRVDEVVVGGGPLMDIEPLNHILYAFSRAAERKAIARVEGCGVGPLKSQPYIQMVAEIFRLSDHISLRDAPSVQRCNAEFNRKDAVEISDPAVDYVLNVQSQLQSAGSPVSDDVNQPRIACFLREWTPEYLADVDPADYETMKQAFELQLSQLLLQVGGHFGGADFSLLPMHTFHVGWDDRRFNRKLSRLMSDHASKYSLEASLHSIYVERLPISPAEIIQNMKLSTLNVCMRFHSVLFAETLGVPYIAIDYTSGGKISAFLKNRSKLNRLISLKEVASGEWKNRLTQILDTL